MKDYARMFALGAAKARDLETMRWFAKLFDGIVSFEMDGHRRYARRFGVSEAELEAGKWRRLPGLHPGAALHGLRRQPGRTDCVTSSVSGRLCRDRRSPGRYGMPQNPFYREWIEMYISDEFKALGQLLRRAAWTASPKERKQEDLVVWEDRYLASARFELLFWQMCWDEETWPV